MTDDPVTRRIREAKEKAAAREGKPLMSNTSWFTLAAIVVVLVLAAMLAGCDRRPHFANSERLTHEVGKQLRR